MTDCIFCKIVEGHLPASIVYRDELCMAFLDIQPVNAGHLLVIPIAHAKDLSELDQSIGAHIFKVAQKLAASLRRASGLRCEGVNLFLADGEAAMQEIFHFHLHVFPRFTGDGFGLKFAPTYFEKPERSELEKVAAAIRDVTSA
jgi:histidine triad (HIT) family protein